MRFLILVIACLLGFAFGVYVVKSGAPLCQDENGLELNEKVLCFQIGEGNNEEN